MIQVVRPRKRLCLRGLTHPVRSPWGSRVTGRVGRGVWARVSTRITGHLFPAPRKGGRGSGPATAGEPIRVGPAWGYGAVGSLLARGVRTVSSCGRPGRDPGWYSGHGSNVQTPKLEFGGSPDGLPELDSPCLLVKGTDCAGDRGGSTGLSRFWKARLPAGMIRAHAGRLMKLCAPCYREGASGYLLVIATRASDPKWSGSMQETMSLSVPVKPLQVVGILLGLPLPLVGVYQCPGCGVEVYGVGVEVVEGEPIPVAHGVLVGGAP